MDETILTDIRRIRDALHHMRGMQGTQEHQASLLQQLYRWSRDLHAKAERQLQPHAQARPQ